MSGINPDGTLKKYDTPKATTPAAIAASTGDLDTLKSLSVAELHEVDEYDNTSLIWAADGGYDECLTYILSTVPDKGFGEKGNVVNARGYLGNTAIGRAARGGHCSCVKLLLDRTDINPDICNEKIQFPLHFAAFKKHLSVVELMLESGKCSTEVKDRKGRTPEEDTNVDEIKNAILRYRASLSGYNRLV